MINLFRTLKSVVIILLFCTFSTTSWAQDKNNKADFKENDLNVSFDQVEIKPEYPGGIKELYKFIIANFRMSEEAKREGVKGQALIEFTIETDGSLANFKIIKDLGFGIGHEVIRLLRRAKKWIPGTSGEKPIQVLYRLPITIG